MDIGPNKCGDILFNLTDLNQPFRSNRLIEVLFTIHEAHEDIIIRFSFWT